MAPTIRIMAFCAMAISLAEAAQRYAAVPLMSDALIPRYFLDKSFPVAKRVGNCDEGEHNCEDTGNSGQCCADDHYCYVGKDGGPRCCTIGSGCPDNNPCPSDRYLCTTTATESGSAATGTACCPRRCPGTSQYLCPSDLGGNCCSYGWECRAGGGCAQTQTPTSSLAPIESGCTTSQHRCDDGQGCCDSDQSCTNVSGTGYCAAGAPTQTNVDYVGEDDDGGLSDGAKAGIGVGAVLGAAIIIGLPTWLCIFKRRKRRRTLTQPSRISGNQQQQEDGTTGTGISEVTPSSRPAQMGQGLTQDYFGPDQVPGPYTQMAHSPTSPGAHRAVPSQPQQPGDIAAPVEIDSDTKTEDGRLSPMSYPSYLASPQPETIEGRFELHEDQAQPVDVPPRSPSIMATPISYTRSEGRPPGS